MNACAVATKGAVGQVSNEDQPVPLSANLAAALETRAEQHGWTSRPAFYTPDGCWTHGEVHRQGHAAAHRLHEAGVVPGDKILLACSDRVDLVSAFLGAARLGAVAVLVNPRLNQADHECMVRDVAPALVVGDADLCPRFERHAPTMPADEFWQLEPRIFPPFAAAPDAPLYAQYTSGTTGSPKAALHRHTDPFGYHAAMAEGVLDLRPDDVVYSISKAHFAYGLGNTVFFALLSGCAAVLDPAKPTLEGAAAIVEAHRATVLFAVPSFFARLVAGADADRFRSLRVAVSAGETLQPALYHRVREWLGTDILDGLGSTEVGQTFISNTPGRSLPGAIGTVLPGYQAAVRDEAGVDLAPGQVGCLWVRGPTVMLGYCNRPVDSAAVLVDGWCRTGDRVSVDRHGVFRHHGRVDDIEIVGGINVSPLEIEAVLLEHPSVVEVAVAAVPDHCGATRLQGFAVLGPDVAWSAKLETDILALARDRLAAFKVPRSLTAVDSLPRTSTGKLRRHVLRRGMGSRRGAEA